MGASALGFVLTIAPPALTWSAWRASADLWTAVVASTPAGSRLHALGLSAGPTAGLLGSLSLLTALIVAHRAQAAPRSAIVAALVGLGAAILLTIALEAERLAGLRPSQSWLRVAAQFDLGVAVACAVGTFVIAAGVRLLRAAACDVAPGPALERAASDNHGHADWMPLAEARQLFCVDRAPLGGVVVGEASRVDQDPIGRMPFDSRDRASWAQGGVAPLLEFDLSWGATHGLVFAGSGGFKTVSTCVPTLLRYRGPVVTLDPSVELAPMLRDARVRMGRRVVTVDPARAEDTGFDVLDWLDVESPAIDADIRAVVDWICGEKPAATVKASSGSKHFFEGRGKALVEALLSDVVFDPALSRDERTLLTLSSRLAKPEKEMRDELDRVHNESASPRARHLAGQLKQLVQETFSGVYGNMSEQTEWLANPRFATLVSGSSFDTRELREGKLDVFLNIPLKVLETTPALARCIVGSLLNAVYEADGQVGARVVFLLDEVARLGFMASLARARDAGRKYGLTLVMIYQSEGQLLDHWGEDGRSAWFESASWRSYAAVGDLAQAKSVSEACGEHGVIATSEGDTQGITRQQPLTRGSKSLGSSETRSEQRRRLITPDEILQDMRTDEQIVFVRGRKPLRCGRALYFRRPEMVSAVAENRFR